MWRFRNKKEFSHNALVSLRAKYEVEMISESFISSYKVKSLVSVL